MSEYAWGRVAYEAYGESTNHRTFLGEYMHAWENLPENIQEAWNAAAQAVRDAAKP